MAHALDTEEMLRLTTRALDLAFANDVEAALNVFATEGLGNSPFTLMGRGVCALLKVVLSMDPELVEYGLEDLTLAEQRARKQMKLAKSSAPSHRFQPGIEWEILHNDIIIFLGLVHALSQSYKGYLQCLYEINRARSKFKKWFKMLYPTGLDGYATPSQPTPAASRQPSETRLQYAEATPAIPVRTSRLFVRWSGLGALTTPTPVLGTITNPANGPVEEFILSGVAFGYGLFNLALSLLPAKIRNLARLFGYNYDRELGLKALAVSAARTDVHAMFAGLLLTTYYGSLLLASGYHADEQHITDQCKSIVRRLLHRHPKLSLCMLNKARIQRISGDSEGAIVTLQEGRQQRSLPQVDELLVIELAWTLSQCRRYEESAQVFMDVSKMNSWNRATYHFLAAGCYVSVRQLDEAQRLFDKLPAVLDKRRGRDMPTEVLIKKKLEFYKKKHGRRGGDPKRFAESVKISPVEELAVAKNTYAHADKETALAHIAELTALTPPVDIQTEHVGSSSSMRQPGTVLDLDTSDELAVRSLILGILHRTLGDYAGARKLLHDALKHYQDVDVNSWVGGMTHFELAVLDMKEGERRSVVMGGGNPVEGETVLEVWKRAIKSARDSLAHAQALCARETDMLLRLDTRIVMLREEINVKMRQLRM
ncbi:outer membrane protein Iml2/Tetratricopeptide repeat protein 39 [Pisolithus tinctorius]|nr:outer membrane protein Iml2/Tetratricopeptide repeat protein 39 [Pisolithus tinctorius]